MGAAAGLWLCRDHAAPAARPLEIRISRGLALAALAAFFLLLAGLPIAAWLLESHALAVAAAFYRAGALVFGGGHVVLPLLEAAVVGPGWVDEAAFLAGYGAAQAVPGPLFTFAAYLGDVMGPPPNGWPGALICLVAIFLPGLLLVLGVLPFWGTLRSRRGMAAAVRGVNAAVVGILLAALYHPVWTSAVRGALDFGVALAAFALLALWHAPPWLVVALTAAAGAGLALR
jgi:chromate transporter